MPLYLNGEQIIGSGGSSGGGHTILDDSGTSLTQQPNLQFKGTYSEDNSTDSVTEVNIVRSMTKAEFDLLSADEKVGIINITDESGVSLKCVKETLWENLDESDMTILSQGSTINLSDNILDYDEIYFEGCFFEVNNATGKKLTHFVVTKVMKETIDLVKSKYGSGQDEGMLDVALNFIYASGSFYTSMYCLKIPTDTSLYVAFKYVTGWNASLCTMTRIIGVKYLQDETPVMTVREMTWTGDGTNPRVITFPKKPTMILSIDGFADVNNVNINSFRYGATTASGTFKGSGQGVLYYTVSYSADELTMSISGENAGAVCNYNGRTNKLLWI